MTLEEFKSTWDGEKMDDIIKAFHASETNVQKLKEEISEQYKLLEERSRIVTKLNGKIEDWEESLKSKDSRISLLEGDNVKLKGSNEELRERVHGLLNKNSILQHDKERLTQESTDLENKCKEAVEIQKENVNLKVTIKTLISIFKN